MQIVAFAETHDRAFAEPLGEGIDGLVEDNLTAILGTVAVRARH